MLDAKQAQNTQIFNCNSSHSDFPYRHTLRNEYLLDLHNKRAVVQACCTISIHTMMFDVVYRLVVCDYSPVRWIISPLLVRRKQNCSFGFFVLSMIIVIIIENMYDFLFVCENHFSRLLSESIRIVGLGIIPVKAFIAPNNGNEIYEQEIQFVS